MFTKFNVFRRQSSINSFKSSLEVLIIASLLFLSLENSCRKDISIHTYSVVNIRFWGEEDDIFKETIEGSWDNNTRLARMYALGYKFEEFHLYLSAKVDTGFYPNPTINNISFTDGLDFIPFKLSSGFIHIDYIDSLTIRGYFRMALDDDFNGSETKTIVGGFGINIH